MVQRKYDGALLEILRTGGFGHLIWVSSAWLNFKILNNETCYIEEVVITIRVYHSHVFLNVTFHWFVFILCFRYCSITSRCSSSLGMCKQSELSDVVSTCGSNICR